MSNKKQILTDWKDWRKFFFENWETISKAYEKSVQEYFNSIDLLHVECVGCLNYNNEICGDWAWTENPNTHKCIKFIDIE